MTGVERSLCNGSTAAIGITPFMQARCKKQATLFVQCVNCGAGLPAQSRTDVLSEHFSRTECTLSLLRQYQG